MPRVTLGNSAPDRHRGRVFVVRYIDPSATHR